MLANDQDVDGDELTVSQVLTDVELKLDSRPDFSEEANLQALLKKIKEQKIEAEISREEEHSAWMVTYKDPTGGTRGGNLELAAQPEVQRCDPCPLVAEGAGGNGPSPSHLAERPIEATNKGTFGLFRYRDRTAARVRLPSTICTNHHGRRTIHHPIHGCREEHSVNTAKEEVLKILDELPDDASLEDIQYRIYVVQKVERGLQELGVA